MYTATTNGVKITAEVFYHPDASFPVKGKYVFAYRIRIQNLNDFPVQLLHRYWKITDSDGIVREVQGPGVIGKQPVILPDRVHEYMSWSPLRTSLGKMEGTYTMIHADTGEEFEARVPSFFLTAPFKNN